MNISEILLKIKAVTGKEPVKSGAQWSCLCPAHHDKKPSLSVTEDAGKILLYCHAGCGVEQIVESLDLVMADLMPPTNGNGHATRAIAPRADEKPKATYATTNEAIAALSASRGKQPDSVWQYHNAAGELVGSVLRWNVATGKQILPVSRQLDGRWACAAMPKPRPLYRLPQLRSALPGTLIYVLEGEKCADAIVTLRLQATTSAGGAKAAQQTDWTPLAGRHVVIIPDRDQAGREYADTVAAHLGHLKPPATVYRIELDGLTEGEDAVEWLSRRPADEIPTQTAHTLASLAKPYPSVAVEISSPADKRRVDPTAELEVLLDGVTFWHNPDNRPFATIRDGNHYENMAIADENFSLFIRRRYFKATNKPLRDDAWQEIYNTIRSLALFDGPRHDTATRIWYTDEGIFLDLGDAAWRIVRITSSGWSVVDGADCPVKFLRPHGMLALPEPVFGGNLTSLRGLLNLPDDEQWILVVAWLLGVLKSNQPQVVLAVTGEQGSAKSSLARILRWLIDPNQAPVRRPPKNEEDLFIAAVNGLIVSLDNVSGVPRWLSDAMCSLATGGGFAKRQLYTDGNEFIMNARRPLLLNGIDDVATRPDLMDRSILIHLPAILDNRRRSEAAISAEFSRIHAEVLGALLTAAATGLKNLPTTQLPTAPRMADFAQWVAACEPALPWPAGEFISAYAANRAVGSAEALDGSLVGSEIVAFMEKQEEWEGTVTELLQLLTDRLGAVQSKTKGWPTNPRGLSGTIARCGPSLRTAGIYFKEMGRDPKSRRKRCRLSKQVSNDVSSMFRNVSGNIPQNANKTDISETSKHLKHCAGAFGGGELQQAAWTNLTVPSFTYRKEFL